MTEDPSPAGFERPQSVIGPITLGTNGGQSITLASGTTLSPAKLGLSGNLAVGGITSSADTVTVNLVQHGTLVITGAGGTVPALPAGALLESIARNHDAHVVIRLGGGSETSLSFAVATGAIVTVRAAGAI